MSMLIQLLISGNKISDTKNNQIKGDLGLKLLYTLEKNLTLMKKIWNKKVNYFDSSFWNKNHLIHSLKL